MSKPIIIKEYVPYQRNVVIQEHRAPTDESVKLLRELENEVLNNLTEKGFVALTNCNLKFQYFKTEQPCTGHTNCIIIGKINGTKYEHKYSYHTIDIMNNKTEESLFLEELNKLLIKIIGNNLEIIVQK